MEVAAVGAERALRAPGRARRVEDGDGVVGLEAGDLVVGERGAVDELGERSVGVGAVGAHADELHAGGPSVLDDALEAVVVEERDGAPAFSSAYPSSAPVHHEFSGTTIAPSSAAPQNPITNSGRLRMAMATRSPRCTPKVVRSCWARASAARARRRR